MVRAIRVLPGHSCAMSFATCTSKAFGTFFTSCAHNMQKVHMALRVLRVAAHHMYIYVHVERSKLTFLTHKLLPTMRKPTICHKRKYDFAVGGSIVDSTNLFFFKSVVLRGYSMPSVPLGRKKGVQC